MRRGDIVDMIYQDGQGHFTRRRIRILFVSKTMIRAYCYLRHQKRTFAVERILASRTILRSAS
ncbi:transcriptional regulator [Sporolactobacillus sp. CPB3-1]|uniref:Transcriptional regulator n=1 Tax=Sporolactobacillus mangiferae TaxID=2940498 RepID=A0ABT0MCA3_9BACL|nr:transcriptional regulator [Sporolactobacillus mangiferae]MCL1632303.1 transcriptional regulator [Sporolactobacillus mangiferae]